MQSTYVGRIEAALAQINDIQSRCEEAIRNVKEIMTEIKEEKTNKSENENPYNQKQMEKFREQMSTSDGHRFIRHLIDKILDQPESHAKMVWYMRDNLMNAYGLDEPTARGKILDFLNELVNTDKVDEKLFMRFCIAMGIKEFELKITTKNTKKKDAKVAINDTFLKWE